MINSNPRAAAETYLSLVKERATVDGVVQLFTQSGAICQAAAVRTMVYAEFFRCCMTATEAEHPISKPDDSPLVLGDSPQPLGRKAESQLAKDQLEERRIENAMATPPCCSARVGLWHFSPCGSDASTSVARGTSTVAEAVDTCGNN